MITFGVVATKGGVGKTTIAANLGGLLADIGYRVLLVDADVQPSLSRYFEVAHEAEHGLTKMVMDGVLTAECVSTIELPPSSFPGDQDRLNKQGGALHLVRSDTRDGKLQDWLSNRLDRLVRIRMAIKQTPLSAKGRADGVHVSLAECDAEIELQLQRLQVHEGDPAKDKKRGRARNAPKFDLRTQLFQMCGVDLTRIDGMDVTTALAVVSEVCTDLSRFPTIKHFTSWLGLCPGTKITGGKVMSGKTARVVSRAAQALRLAAAALRSSKSALGAYFRRMCSRMDKPKAVTAAAHKLARLIYTMLTKGQQYTDQGQDY